VEKEVSKKISCNFCGKVINVAAKPSWEGRAEIRYCQDGGWGVCDMGACISDNVIKENLCL
jgi:hypothetical protein